MPEYVVRTTLTTDITVTADSPAAAVAEIAPLARDGSLVLNSDLVESETRMQVVGVVDDGEQGPYPLPSVPLATIST